MGFSLCILSLYSLKNHCKNPKTKNSEEKRYNVGMRKDLKRITLYFN